MKIITSLSMLLVMLISAAAIQPDEPFRKADRHDPQDVTITCPASVTYQLQPVEGWSPGIDGVKRIAFESASADGRIIFCTYEVNNGSGRVSATLQKPMPAGLVCAVFNGGSKSRMFTCKRPGPITIKPKSD